MKNKQNSGFQTYINHNVEIEVISYGNYEDGDNYDQCMEYMTKLGITDEMLLNKSYSDIMGETGN